MPRLSQPPATLDAATNNWSGSSFGAPTARARAGPELVHDVHDVGVDICLLRVKNYDPVHIKIRGDQLCLVSELISPYAVASEQLPRGRRMSNNQGGGVLHTTHIVETRLTTTPNQQTCIIETS